MNDPDDNAPAHPGAMLADEMARLAMSAADLAVVLSIPKTTAEALLARRAGITPELALRLAQCFGTSARFWTDLQNAYDLHIAEQKYGAAIAAQITPRPTLDDIPVWASGSKPYADCPRRLREELNDD